MGGGGVKDTLGCIEKPIFLKAIGDVKEIKRLKEELGFRGYCPYILVLIYELDKRWDFNANTIKKIRTSISSAK